MSSRQIRVVLKRNYSALAVFEIENCPPEIWYISFTLNCGKQLSAVFVHSGSHMCAG